MTRVILRDFFFGFRRCVGEIFALLPFCSMWVGKLCLDFLPLGGGAGTFSRNIVKGYQPTPRNIQERRRSLLNNTSITTHFISPVLLLIFRRTYA
jgi:hypothetical protein